MLAKRVDANQREIVAWLRKKGASVLIMSNLGKGAPDIAVGINGKTYLFEIKDGSKPPSAQELTEHEQMFFDSWKGHVAILRSTSDVSQFFLSLID